MPKLLRDILSENTDKMPRHPKDNNAWMVKTKAHFDAIKDHTVPATLAQMTNNRGGRTVVHAPAGVRIEKEKGLLKKKVPHLLG